MQLKRFLCAAVATGTLVLAGNAANATLVNGLVEYWEMDGNFSANVTAAHAGTLTTTGTGSGNFVAGKFGQAIDLQNSVNNQAVIVVGGNENDFDLTGQAVSFSLWYTTESLYTSFQTLIGKGENSSWRAARSSSSGTNVKLSVGGANGNAKLNLQDGSWHNLIGVYDGTGTQLFVDGSLVASTATNGNLPGNVGNAMQIGGNPQAANRGWNGNIDDVAIWNRALTSAEVALIFNNGDGASIRSLVAPPVVPEPATATLGLLALGGLMMRRRRMA